MTGDNLLSIIRAFSVNDDTIVQQYNVPHNRSHMARNFLEQHASVFEKLGHPISADINCIQNLWDLPERLFSFVTSQNVWCTF